MAVLPTNRFQLMNRLSQTYLVDSISRVIDYRLRFHRLHGIGADNDNDNLVEKEQSSGKTFYLKVCMVQGDTFGHWLKMLLLWSASLADQAYSLL